MAVASSFNCNFASSFHCNTGIGTHRLHFASFSVTPRKRPQTIQRNRYLAMSILPPQSAESNDKPSPWRFIRWHKANKKQEPFQSHAEEEKRQGNFVYKVLPGESLEEIASRFNTYVEVLMEANHILNPRNLVSGQLLWIPLTYKIKKGDTLYSLSRRFGVKIQAIQAANGIENPNLIFADDIIVIPEEAELEDMGMVN